MFNSTVSDLHMNIPGIDSNNHKDMANAISTKFVSVSSHIEPLNISTLPAYLPVDDTPPTLHPWEVYKELKAIKSSKASGPDGIPPSERNSHRRSPYTLGHHLPTVGAYSAT